MKLTVALVLSLFITDCIAQSWQQLGLQGVGGVADIAEYNGDLYITGGFEEIGGVTVNHIARWNGTAWGPVGTGLTDYGYGTCMAVYNGELYVAGYFDTAGGVNAYRIARWNGTTWSNVLNGLDMLLVAHDMLVIGNVLYIGGSIDLACNTPLVNIVQWNGSAFSTVGTGELELLSSSLVHGTVYSLAEQQGELYVAGNFDHVNGLACEGLLRWDGSAWHAGPSGLPTTFNLDVGFINGALTCAQNSSLVMQWNGGQWTNFTSGWSGSGSTSTMVVYNGVPIIAGRYNAGPFALNPDWAELGSIAGSPGIGELRIIGNALYAVGDQGIVVSGNVERHTVMAKWVGPLSVPHLTAGTIGLYPNPASDRIRFDQPARTKGDVRIMDVTGRAVEGWSMDGDGQMNIAALPPGLYQLQARYGDRLSMGRFVKE